MQFLFKYEIIIVDSDRRGVFMTSVKQEYLNRTYHVLSNSNAQRRRFLNANYGANTPIDGKELESK